MLFCLRCATHGWRKDLAENKLSENVRAGRPGVCRSCGAIVGAGEKICAQCGVPLATADATRRGDADDGQPKGLRMAYDREALRFARAVFTRPASFTIIFIAANVFVFLLMSQGNTSNVWEPSVATLLAYGAKFNSLINAGQWWRFITPMFIHIGVIHLLVNMYGLFMLGPYVEKLYGSAKFVVFWVVAGAGGVAASYFAASHQMQGGLLGHFLFRGGDGPSAGASGALFGLIGVLFVFGIKFRHELPEELKRAFGAGMLPTILLNLFIGYTVPFIDNAAHLGGLAAGAALALVIDYKRPNETRRVAFVWQLLQFALLALVAVSFLMVARHFKEYPQEASNANASSVVLPFNEASKFISYFKAINEGQQAFVSALNNHDANAVNQAVKALDDVPPLDEQADALRNDLRTLLIRARGFAVATPQQLSNTRARKQGKELGDDFQSWKKKFREYIQTNSAKYGLELRETPQENDAPDKK